MAKLGAVIGLCAGTLALIGCGGSDGARTDGLGADWTLTITSPEHGERVPMIGRVEVAVTGRAAVRGDERTFDIGYFVDDELVAVSSDTSAEIELVPGTRSLAVQGVDEEGLVIEEVVGDEIVVDVSDQFEESARFDPPPGALDVRLGRARFQIPGVAGEVDSSPATEFDVVLPTTE